MSLVGKIAELQDYKEYEDLHWEGSFEEYVNLVKKNPRVTRNAFQRVYDMVLSHGVEEYIDNKKKLVRYNFFKDEAHGGHDAVFGLDVTLMRLMNVLKSAAQGYGTEKRVILLHGPVGSSKSTIARLLKQGLEEYSRQPEGALYSYHWELPKDLAHLAGGSEFFECPMHDEPLRLIPRAWRNEVTHKLALKGHAACARQEAHAQRAGSRRHRHLSAQRREEPGLHRAHRRYQLPQDCRVWLRFGPACLQL
jgi:serine protein kinase